MSDNILEFIRDMASPSDGPDLTDEELAEVLQAMAQESVGEQEHGATG